MYYSPLSVYYVKRSGESKPIDDAKLARIETYIIDAKGWESKLARSIVYLKAQVISLE